MTLSLHEFCHSCDVLVLAIEKHAKITQLNISVHLFKTGFSLRPVKKPLGSESINNEVSHTRVWAKICAIHSPGSWQAVVFILDPHYSALTALNTLNTDVPDGSGQSGR